MFARLTISARIRVAFGAAGALVFMVALHAYQGVSNLEQTGARIAEKEVRLTRSHAEGKDLTQDYTDPLDDLVAAAQQTKREILIVGACAVMLGGLFALGLSRSIFLTLLRIMLALKEGTEQVNEAAGQVAANSHELAEGASQQAVSLEETSSALLEIADMTHKNSDDANKASTLSMQARTAAENVDRTMTRLNQAMKAINDSSGQIKKIIKVIEGIAFQTNLLALNAAVEAARAGEHGRGFSVVASEVRNLAQRSAQAASETTALIEQSVQRADEGADVASEVVSSLGVIVADVGEVTTLINRIAQASADQTSGVDQATTSVNQMDNLTQQNAANAEESAAAIEQLSDQAAQVNRLSDRLQSVINGRRAVSGSVSSGIATTSALAPFPSESEADEISPDVVSLDQPASSWEQSDQQSDLDDFLTAGGGEIDEF